jgi:hypothetical protein
MSLGMKTLSLLAGLAAATVPHAPEAAAGTFRVFTCNDAASAGIGAWEQVRTAATTQLELAAVCPSGTPDPYRSLQNGIAVGDVVNAWNDAAPDGSYAEWRFSAPDGAAIVAASVSRDIGNRDEWTPYGRIDGVDQAGESCMPGVGEAFCRIQGTRVFSGLNARTIAYGVRCVVAPYCAHLWDLRAVWVLVLGATVTVDDRQAPTVSSVDVAGVGGGNWWNRVGSVSFSAQDNTGVRRRRVLVDGVVRTVVDAPGASAGGCGELGRGVAYSYSRPCADGRGLNGVRSVVVEPCRWGDGAHAVRGSAVDTGGLETTSSVAATVRVDCTAPTLTVTRRSAEVVEGDVVEPPVVESVDSASGVAATSLEVSVDAAPWVDAAAAVVAAAGRSYVFRARAVDVAGNWSPWRVAEPVVGVAAPPPPPPPPPPPGPEVDAGAQADQGSSAGAGPVPEAARPIAAADGGGGSVGRTGETAPVLLGPPIDLIRRGEAREAAALLYPRVRITRVSATRRRVEVRGVAAPALTTTATVTVRVGRRARTRRIAVAGGRWRANIALRRARRGRKAVRVETDPTATHDRGTARWPAPVKLHPLR